jgi:tRNA threonylcarbamoyladenosine biosynthesis protein TsaE
VIVNHIELQVFKNYGNLQVNMNKVFQDVTLVDLPEVAQEILTLSKGMTIWKFEGNLGAGKTTFIKVFCKELNVAQHVQSPTFAIVNEYETGSGDVLYHFDCYRLKNQEEAFDFGIEEYLDSGNLCLIEWPQIIDDLLPKPHVLISIEGNDKRVITLKTIE